MRSLAVIVSAMAAGRPVAAQFKLAGSPDGTLPILVDDGLDVYVNDVQVHTDGVQASGLREPFPIGGAVGDTVRLVVRDTYGVCAQLTPVFSHQACQALSRRSTTHAIARAASGKSDQRSRLLRVSLSSVRRHRRF